MSKLVKPTSDEGRLDLLKTSLTAAQNDAKLGNPYLSDSTISATIAHIPLFSMKFLDETGKLAVRSKEVREKNQGTARLEMFIRDMWDVTKRRVARNGEPAEVLTYYQLPLDGTVPAVISEKEIFTFATGILEGDRKAIAAGFPAAVCPSAEELNDVLAQTRKEFDDVTPADRDYNLAQAALAPVRLQADALIADIAADLEHTLRKLDSPMRRRIMRTYGFTFEYALGEPVDEATTATATATTATAATK